MKKINYIFLIFIGLLSLISSCKKDGTNVEMLANPIVPTLDALPDLTLQRANGRDTIEFKGTPVKPGFTASANYFLEACPHGNNFNDSVYTIMTSVQDSSFKISVSDLNGKLLKGLPENKTSAVDFRIRSVLVVDAGTGAPGTSTKPFVYSSLVQTAMVTLYGLPRLDLISNSEVIGKIVSPLGDGNYSGYVKLSTSQPYTFKDPDANVNYGASGASLSVDGPAITSESDGWYMVKASTTGLTFQASAYMIGLVGSATPNQWNSPDQKMDYDAKSGTWKITITLVDGEIKFRLNDGWAWNLGWNKAKDGLTHNGDNIAVTAGNYTIALTITNDVTGSETGTFTIVKN